jgi:alpha-1,2-mannosyltransferase
VAVGAFAATTLAGWVVAPSLSDAFWLRVLFLDSSRVAAATGPAFVGNQSLRGVVLRTVGETTDAQLVWVLSALAVTAAGLALAVLAHRRGEEAIAVVTAAFTALLVSPLSWSHHWVWVAVLLPLLLEVTLRIPGRAQVLPAALLAVWTAMLVTWPLRRRPEDPLKANGIIWVAYRHAQPVHWLGENMYVLAVLGTMLLAACWLRTRGDAPTMPDSTNQQVGEPVGSGHTAEPQGGTPRSLVAPGSGTRANRGGWRRQMGARFGSGRVLGRVSRILGLGCGRHRRCMIGMT